MKKFVISLFLDSLGSARKRNLAYSILQQLADEPGLETLRRAHLEIDTLLRGLDDEIRRREYAGKAMPSKSCPGSRTPMPTSVRAPNAPWTSLAVEPSGIPNMLMPEEMQYYEYAGRLYEGRGEAVELGPWLGASTTHAARGLAANPRFRGKKLHVYDDFVWRSSWMDRHYDAPDRPAHHADFRPIFERYTNPIHEHLIVNKNRITNYDGNESLPLIAWDKSPIELMYIDCGRTLEANNGWWRLFSPSFIPGVTLLVLQDWGTHRERPRLPYNQTLLFTQQHGSRLELVHETAEGNIATFLYVA